MSQHLINLISKLREGSIAAIEYGVATEPGGAMADHRILCIRNPIGLQFCFKHIINGRFGSGAAIGDREDRILALSAKWVSDYKSPHANPKLQTNFDSKNRPIVELEYFAIPK